MSRRAGSTELHRRIGEAFELSITDEARKQFEMAS
jgi:hypothetical protein